MFGKEYYVEPTDSRIHYEIVSRSSQLALVHLWKHNRPPDRTRVSEMVTHLKESNVCDGQILLAVINGECVCYDGAHRLYAIREYFPKGGVQVRILYDSSEEEVRKEFIRINKSVPVPSLYFSDNEIVQRLTRIVHNVARGVAGNYPHFVSTSRKPQRPNFNRDHFTEELGEILRETLSSQDIMELTEEMIGGWLTNVNDTLKTSSLRGVSQRIKDKCRQHNFYIFAGDWKKIIANIIKK